MRNPKNSLKLFIWIGFIFCVGMLGPKMVAFAGGINENEAGVIAAASGTFTYDGKTYRANKKYINSLTSYLSGDAIDLTAEDASRAIAKMYASVAEGIEKGYIYEVEDNQVEEPQITESQNTGTQNTGTQNTGTQNTGTQTTGTQNTGAQVTETQAGNVPSTERQFESTHGEMNSGNQTNAEPGQNSDKKNPQDVDEIKQTVDKDLDIWEAMSEQAEVEEKLEQRPGKEDAAASVHLGEKDIVVTTKENNIINISKEEQLIPDKILMEIDIVAGILFAVTVMCGVILFATKCMSFKKPKNRRARPGHSRRRKIRRYTRNILTITTSISIVGIIALLGSYVGLFNQNAIMQNMQSSGYFRYAYSEYITGIAGETASKLEEGGELADVDKIVSYEDYLFAIKQNSVRILNGETNIKVPDSNVTPYIYNMKRSYMQLFQVAGIFIILSMVFSIILMIFMDQRRDRGVKHTAVAELVASGLMILIVAVMLFDKPYRQLYIEPDYLYLFITECVNWCMKVMTSIVAFGVVLGMILIGVYKTMANHHSDD